jgi:pimeloyl-ACP methyl ester carboxylesterase
MTTRLRHAAVELALHELRSGEGRHLLLLHGLGERAPHAVPVWAEAWPGPVAGLDFTGHGESSVPRGGGYSCEVLMGDADIALAELGPSTVVGRGLGAYVALLIAGARPRLVRGAVLADGPGMSGGGVGPGSTAILSVDRDEEAPPDPWALAELSRDVRPPDYASAFARAATQLSGLPDPLAVSARWRPPWLEAVAAEPGVATVRRIEDGLAIFSRV